MFTFTEAAGALLAQMIERKQLTDDAAIRLIHDREEIFIKYDTVRPGDAKFEHEGRVVLLLDAGMVQMLADDTLAAVGREPALDSPRDGAGYAVFGRVIEGMETVNKIKDVEVQNVTEKRMRNVPVEPVVINSVKLIGLFDRSRYEKQVKVTEEAAKKAAAVARVAQENEMQEFIKKTEDETGKKFATTDSGLKYIVLQEGTGDTTPNPTDNVEVHYTGWLLNGTKFDSSVDRGKAATFRLNGVIAGWTEGVGLMKVGEKRKLIIPPELAYGPAGRPGIPPNSTLVFDVELLSIP